VCVRDLALPLIFLIAEDTAGAGMMRGVFVLSLSTLRPLPPSAPTRGAGKAAARTRGEATKRNACATSVAPGVPKGRALGPLAVVTRARTPQSPTLRYTTIFIGKTTSKLSSNRFASLVDPRREADSIFRSFSDPLLPFLYFHRCITIGVELPPPPQNSSAMAEI